MKLRFVPAAFDDLTHICDYIVEHRGEAQARRVGARLRASIDLLLQFPYAGHIGEVAGTRVLKVAGQPYIVIYRVAEAEETIEVLHIYHERQNWRGPIPS